MYLVWESKVKTDMGMSYVRNHEADQDAQAIWRELVAHQTTLTTSTIMHQNLLAHLSTTKLDASVWCGTYVGFLVNLTDNMREYKRWTPVADHYPSEMKDTLLMQAVASVQELDLIKTQCELEMVQGRPMSN